MSTVQTATGKLVFRTRIDTVKRTIDTFKGQSIVDALADQAKAFGRNNRQLLRNFTGYPR